MHGVTTGISKHLAECAPFSSDGNRPSVLLVDESYFTLKLHCILTSVGFLPVPQGGIFNIFTHYVPPTSRPANSHGFTVSLTVSLPCSRAADRTSRFLRPANSHGFTNLRWIESHGL